MLKNLLKRKQMLNKDQIAEILKINTEMINQFEEKYESTSLYKFDDNFFTIKKQFSNIKIKSDYDVQKLNNIIDDIVKELLVVAGLEEADENFKPITKEELNEFPLKIRPQLSGTLIQKDIGEYAYIALLTQYENWKKTGDIKFYHSFRQGLDILDLDPITYEIR